MRVNYKTDVPLAGGYEAFMGRERLLAHRDSVMGDLAAQLNVLLDGAPFCSLQQIIRSPAVSGMRGGKHYTQQVQEAAMGYLAHQQYFTALQQAGEPTCPTGETAWRLKRDYGSLERFAYIFRQQAREAPVTSFLWLCTERRGRSEAFRILVTPGHRLPPLRFFPVLALDLWEHAYLDAFGQDRGRYAAAYLSAVDWSRLSIHP